MSDHENSIPLSGGIYAYPISEGRHHVHYRGVWELEHDGPLRPDDLLDIRATVDEILDEEVGDPSIPETCAAGWMDADDTEVDA